MNLRSYAADRICVENIGIAALKIEFPAFSL